MKTTARAFSFILAAMLIAAPAFAQQVQPQAVPDVAVMAEPQDTVMEKVADLQTRWAEIKYHGADKDKQMKQMETLGIEASGLVAAYPDRAEPKIWTAIILSTEAGIIKGLSALPKVKQAKSLLEEAVKIDPNALQGSAYTTLGSLYYQVPGWPIAFGDSKKAEKSLQAALAINPEGIDANYFFGDYLVHEERYAAAVPVLEKALAAPDRPGRALADEGRRAEIRTVLDVAKEKSTSTPKDKKYN